MVKNIPSDYEGVMGVPISIMDKYSPEQFEILGTSDNGLIDDNYKKTQGLTKEFVDDYYRGGESGSHKRKSYSRITMKMVKLKWLTKEYLLNIK